VHHNAKSAKAVKSEAIILYEARVLSIFRPRRCSC